MVRSDFTCIVEMSTIYILLLKSLYQYFVHGFGNAYSFFVLFCFVFLLYNIVLVLPYINMLPPQVYMCSPSWTLLSSLSLYLLKSYNGERLSQIKHICIYIYIYIYMKVKVKSLSHVWLSTGSAQFSCSVVSNSLWTRGLHTAPHVSLSNTNSLVRHFQTCKLKIHFSHFFLLNT